MHFKHFIVASAFSTHTPFWLSCVGLRPSSYNDFWNDCMFQWNLPPMLLWPANCTSQLMTSNSLRFLQGPSHTNKCDLVGVVYREWMVWEEEIILWALKSIYLSKPYCNALIRDTDVSVDMFFIDSCHIMMLSLEYIHWTMSSTYTAIQSCVISVYAVHWLYWILIQHLHDDISLLQLLAEFSYSIFFLSWE